MLLLSWCIEEAFDRLRISFSAHPLQNDVFVMKVWDDSVRNELIWEGAQVLAVEGDNTIGYYEGASLILALPNSTTRLQPFKRALSYQEFMCFAQTTQPIRDCPGDFSSTDFGESWTQKRGDLLVLRQALNKEIDQETDESAI